MGKLIGTNYIFCIKTKKIPNEFSYVSFHLTFFQENLTFAHDMINLIVSIR